MAGTNNKTRKISTKTIFGSAKPLLSSSVSFNQGDILVFDTVNKVLKKPANDADCATLLGIAPVTVINGVLATAYQGTAVDASQAITTVEGPEYGDVFKLTLKTGDSLNPGDQVYADPGTGTDGVTATGSKAIGVYQGAAISGAAAGTKVEVLVGARFPNDTLKL